MIMAQRGFSPLRKINPSVQGLVSECERDGHRGLSLKDFAVLVVPRVCGHSNDGTCPLLLSLPAYEACQQVQASRMEFRSI